MLNFSTLQVVEMTRCFGANRLHPAMGQSTRPLILFGDNGHFRADVNASAILSVQGFTPRSAWPASRVSPILPGAHDDGRPGSQ